MSFITAAENLWTEIKTAVTGEVTTVEAKLTAFEQAMLPKAIAMIKQIEATIGQQGVTILEEGLTDVVASGGNIGAAIAAFVPQAIATAKADLTQDTTNAAHGAAALILASLPTAAPVADTVPAA